MSWHGFEPEEEYLLINVLSICEHRVDKGQVEAADQKRGLLELMRQHAPETVVWSPFSAKGWGASPFNPNCWRAVDGARVLPATAEVPELPDDA